MKTGKIENMIDVCILIAAICFIIAVFAAVIVAANPVFLY